MNDAAMQQAKRPRTVLAGPYGHPFHGLLVTIPIGAWVASLIFDIAAAVGADPDAFRLGAMWLVGIGVIGALLAAAVGLMDLSQLARGTRVRKLALTHMTLNLTVTALFIVSWLMRMGDLPHWSAVIPSIIGLVILAFSGFLGGELAYRYGVRVADEQTQRTGFEP